MKKIEFGFQAMQAGQKSSTVNAEPRLIVNSTTGKFTITATVSKALNIAVGEHIQFLNNISDIEAAIASHDPLLIEWAKENAVDLDTKEGKDVTLKTFATFAICKGVPQYNSKGEELMASVRYTRGEKLAAAIANIDGLLESENAREVIGEVMQNAEFTKEELIEVLSTTEDNEFTTNVKDFIVSKIESPKYRAHTGSKTSTVGNATGVGCKLDFSDTAIWNVLKADLGDAKETKNRIYRVNLEDAITNAYAHNGQQNVQVTAYRLEFLEDVDPIVRTK